MALLAAEVGIRITQGSALSNLGVVHQLRGDHERAEECHRRALEVAREIANRLSEGGALTGLGRAHLSAGRCEEAVSRFGQVLALALATTIGDLNMETEALLGFGDAAWAAGDPAGALEHHGRALALADRTGDLHCQAQAHDGLGQAHHRRGTAGPAARHWQRALALYSGLGAPQAKRVDGHLSALDGGHPAAG
ncbi:tetratricopeptide repeat protein [Solihabitans fulvus]|uniref:Tetratricopeptide repeat protein n=1 Tax=Solihabitans fulvus TaxID=1892852 RepID=A0A5B2XEN9_9PSEU|nr:tetratricopeptide repeat protein [Solihabitans fulvus]KAA2261515.1 tetratricopeptide repeat protein [Solihabitans fulvus]